MKSDLNLKILPRSKIFKRIPSYKREAFVLLLIDQDNRLESPIWGRLNEI